MRSSMRVPNELKEEIQRMAKDLKEKPATVLRLAIRAGLPTLGQQAPRPDGYFASAYEDYPEERAALERASTNTRIPPDPGCA